MFFGLTNSLAMFQMMMNDIFRELIDEGAVVIYMDNILIFSGQTKEEHHTIVVWVLDILCRHWLYLKAEKCTFWATHGRVSQAHPLGRSCRDGSCQSGWHPQLANPEERHRGPIIHQVCHFLPAIHPGLFACSQTPSPAHQKGGSMEMGRRRMEGL